MYIYVKKTSSDVSFLESARICLECSTSSYEMFAVEMWTSRRTDVLWLEKFLHNVTVELNQNLWITVTWSLIASPTRYSKMLFTLTWKRHIYTSIEINKHHIANRSQRNFIKNNKVPTQSNIQYIASFSCVISTEQET